MNKSQALNNFWSGFSIPAFDSATVPDGQALPYITYETAESTIGDPTTLTASIWYRSKSWEEISQKADEISRAIGYGGKLVEYDGGRLWLTRGTPFIQRMADPDDSIRRIVLLITAEYLSAE